MASDTLDTLTIQEADEMRAASRVRSISASSKLASLLMPLASLRLLTGARLRFLAALLAEALLLGL